VTCLWLAKLLFASHKAKDRSIAAEEKLTKMFMEGWADREMAAKAYGKFRLLLQYMHKVKPQA
jgi:hypothetical protein